MTFLWIPILAQKNLTICSIFHPKVSEHPQSINQSSYQYLSTAPSLMEIASKIRQKPLLSKERVPLDQFVLLLPHLSFNQDPEYSLLHPFSLKNTFICLHFSQKFSKRAIWKGHTSSPTILSILNILQATGSYIRVVSTNSWRMEQKHMTHTLSLLLFHYLNLLPSN